jgi:RimJ/RimL family protein N-acetyltransferase
MIETERLSLRPHAIADADAYVGLWLRAGRAGHTMPNAQPLGAEEAWTRLLRMIGHWAGLGFGPFVVIERVSAAIVGEVGFQTLRRGLGPTYDGVPEAMWRIDPGQQGKGVAGEAVRAAAGWFDATQPADRTVCMIDPPNIASQRVAAAIGFRQFATTPYHGNPVLLFERGLGVS